MYVTNNAGQDTNYAYEDFYNNTVKFNFKNSDVPIFVNSIPAMLDLDAAQDLDRRK